MFFLRFVGTVWSCFSFFVAVFDLMIVGLMISNIVLSSAAFAGYLIVPGDILRVGLNVVLRGSSKGRVRKPTKIQPV